MKEDDARMRKYPKLGLMALLVCEACGRLYCPLRTKHTPGKEQDMKAKKTFARYLKSPYSATARFEHYVAHRDWVSIYRHADTAARYRSYLQALTWTALIKGERE